MANVLRAAGVRRAVLAAGLILWLAALVPGVRALRAFESTAGKMAAAPGDWPSQVPLVGATRLPTLVVALHPRCSCSQATLAELEGAAAEFNHPYNAVLLIYRPRGDRYDWERSSLYREAQQALHASVVIDNDGELAREFGAFTSGEVLYYSAPDSNAKRHLLFSGGITGGRGMVGANVGVEALKIAANSGAPLPVKDVSPKVYGCGFAALSAATGRPATP